MTNWSVPFTRCATCVTQSCGVTSTRLENRIESYHQLRSTIAQANGKKELTGRTDLEVAASNHCGRLIANVVIAYNSMLLSELLARTLTAGNEKALELLRPISPAAWQHLHFLGHYAFRDKGMPINLQAILAGFDELAAV
jgi:hypothetical protein